MSGLRTIQSVAPADVHKVIRKALRSDLDLDLTGIETFLGSIDWSGADADRPDIADLLDELEHTTTLFSEGDISRDDFVRSLEAILHSSAVSR